MPCWFPATYLYLKTGEHPLKLRTGTVWKNAPLRLPVRVRILTGRRNSKNPTTTC